MITRLSSVIRVIFDHPYNADYDRSTPAVPRSGAGRRLCIRRCWARCHFRTELTLVSSALEQVAGRSAAEGAYDCDEASPYDCHGLKTSAATVHFAESPCRDESALVGARGRRRPPHSLLPANRSLPGRGAHLRCWITTSCGCGRGLKAAAPINDVGDVVHTDVQVLDTAVAEESAQEVVLRHDSGYPGDQAVGGSLDRMTLAQLAGLKPGQRIGATRSTAPAGRPL
jgi:hypothetical protein